MNEYEHIRPRIVHMDASGRLLFVNLTPAARARVSAHPPRLCDGSGGLIRAYGGAAAACLRAGKLVEIVAVCEATIAVTFSDLTLMKARLASIAGVRIRQESFHETGATLMVDLPDANAPQIARMIMDITSGRASVTRDP